MSLVGLEDRLVDVIINTIPSATDADARAFVQDMLSNKIELLESQDFIKAEAKSLDSDKLERFVVVQYLVSTGK